MNELLFTGNTLPTLIDAAGDQARMLCVPKTSSVLTPDRIIHNRSEMIALMCFCLRLFTLPFKSKIRLEAENAILRHQLIVVERQIRGRVPFINSDRLFFIWLYRWRLRASSSEWLAPFRIVPLR
jgi:hypothetical protein